MRYEEFIDSVANRTALPRDVAETPTRATLQVLDADEFAQRVSRRNGLNAAAGCWWLRRARDDSQAVSPGKLEDVLAQLGREFAELVDPTS